MNEIEKNFAAVTKRIQKACERAGRNPAEICLVAASKTVPIERIREAASAGIKVFGENYIQEAAGKIGQIGKAVSWHFIGHLQANKAKHAAELFDMVHSVDSLRVAESLNRACEKQERVLPVLIQINISAEASKSGIAPDAARELIDQAARLKNLAVRGLMTMPPFFDNPEESRPYFIVLRNLRDALAARDIENICLQELSMGMSADFEVAIEEGATMVRVGSAIFGERAQPAA